MPDPISPSPVTPQPSGGQLQQKDLSSQETTEKTDKTAADVGVKEQGTTSSLIPVATALPPPSQSHEEIKPVINKIDVLAPLLERKVSPTKFFKTLELTGEATELFAEPYFVDFKIKFFQLLFENPKYMLELLKNKKFQEIDFNEFEIHQGVKSFFKMTSGKDRECADCIEILLKNYKVNNNIFIERLFSGLAQFDLPHSASAILKGITTFKLHQLELSEEILGWDSSACFKKFLEMPIDSSEIQQLISKAAEVPAPRCLSYLIAHYGIEKKKKEELLNKFVEKGQAEMVYALCNGNAEAASNGIFSDIIPLLNNWENDKGIIIEKLKEKVGKMLRFTPIDLVDRIGHSFLSRYSTKENALTTIFEEAKREFLKAAPFISRYTKKADIEVSVKTYNPAKKTADVYSEDLAYARFCRNEVENYVQTLNKNIKLEPIENEYTQLPASKKGTRRAAAILESIGKTLSKKRRERRAYGDFGVFRKEPGAYTPLNYRYKWATPFINVVYLSNAKDKVPGAFGSDFFYKGIEVNSVIATDINFARVHHGEAYVKDTWGDVEDLFEEIMALDLRRPQTNDEKAIKDYQSRLDSFYSKAAELVWLIGNTQPFERGSGTVAEWFFGIIHLHHGLEPPLLKTDFPQLDVLDISFPLSDYKHFFTYFFEPSTLPDHIIWPNLSSKSLLAQMETLYALKASQ